MQVRRLADLLDILDKFGLLCPSKRPLSAGIEVQQGRRIDRLSTGD
jgi:hypothetical protein